MKLIRSFSWRRSLVRTFATASLSFLALQSNQIQALCQFPTNPTNNCPQICACEDIDGCGWTSCTPGNACGDPCSLSGTCTTSGCGGGGCGGCGDCDIEHDCTQGVRAKTPTHEKVP